MKIHKTKHKINYFLLSGILSILLTSNLLSFQDYSNLLQSSAGRSSINGSCFGINPALLDNIDSAMISIEYTPSRFNLQELSYSSLYSSCRISGNAAAGAGIHYSGMDLYNEFTFEASFAFRLRNLSLGARLEYDRLGIKNYSSDSRIRANIGGLIRINDYLYTGFSLQNITGASFGSDSKSAARKGLFGIGMDLSESLKFDIDASISFNHNSGVSFSARYDFENLLSIKAGVLTNPRIMEFGAAIKTMQNFGIYTFLSYHDELGFDKRLGLEYYF